jgi:hypothetical protein
MQLCVPPAKLWTRGSTNFSDTVEYKMSKEPLWLNWQGRGYFGVPHEAPRPFPNRPLEHAEAAWMSAFAHARNGDFRHVGKIAGLIGNEYETMYYDTCAELIGDAGPSQIFPELVAYIARCELNYELTYSWCSAIAARGRLGDVPTLFDAYVGNISDVDDDHDIILMYIAEVIYDGEGPNFGHMSSFRDVDDYRAQMNAHCLDLARRFGGDDVLFWHGQPTSVRHMAKHIIDLAHAKYRPLPTWARRRFEASTGIDCTKMFDRKGNYRPIEAAAIAEAFLDGPTANDYTDGVRYFFGHPVP